MVLLGLLTAGHQAAAAVKIGARAPDFTLKSVRGDNLKLSEYIGEVVVVNFWASWCSTCREQMPILNDIHLRYRETGLVMLGVNVDKKMKKARRMLDELRVVFPILFDTSNNVSKRYDIDAMPTTYLIDRDGNIRYIHNGYSPGYEEDYERQIRELMRE